MTENPLANKVENNEPESFIVQNITLGYHFVTDINLQFTPREVKDLTWEDQNIIKKSRHLKDSLKRGILKKLTPEEYDKTMEMQYQKEKKLLLKDMQKKPDYKKLKIDGKDVLADTFDVSKASKNKEKLDFSGSANDTMSYVAAYEIAQGFAAEKGDILTAEEFGEIVENDPGIVKQLLSNYKQASSKIHSAYFITPPNDSGLTGVNKEAMSNYNRDKRYAGAYDIDVKEHPDTVDLDSDSFYDDDDGDGDEDYAEEIVIDDEE